MQATSGRESTVNPWCSSARLERGGAYASVVSSRVELTRLRSVPVNLTDDIVAIVRKLLVAAGRPDQVAPVFGSRYIASTGSFASVVDRLPRRVPKISFSLMPYSATLMRMSLTTAWNFSSRAASVVSANAPVRRRSPLLGKAD